MKTDGGPALKNVSWKLHSWKGSWVQEHLTRNGKQTLCGVTIPKNPWAKSEDRKNVRRYKSCKNCAMLSLEADDER